MEQASMAQDWEGTGKPESPYLLKTEEDLRLLYQRVMRDSKPYTDCYFELTQDIAMSKQEWKAIGSAGKQFQGNFDGGFHHIFGLQIKPTDYTGFFGYIGNKGVVQNLGVSGTISDAALGNTCGGIAGTNNGTISACLSQMDIILEEGTLPKLCAVGMIVGVNAQRAILRACVAKGTIAAKKTAGAAPYTYYIGGIAGQNSALTGVVGCVSVVEINTSGIWQKTAAAGGIIGYSKSSEQSALQCCSLGTIKGEAKAGFAAVVGEGKGITGCYTLQAVSQSERDGTVVQPSRLLEASFLDELNQAGEAEFAGEAVCCFGQPHPVRPLPGVLLGEESPINFRERCVVDQDFPLVQVAGQGTAAEPFALSRRPELFHGACHPDLHVRLEKDITVGDGPAYQPPEVFQASFDGNGKRLDFSAQAPEGTGFLQGLQGSLKNLTLIYQQPAKAESFSGLVEENHGEISGCTVEGVLEGGPELCGLVRRNKGRMTDCSCKGNLILRGSGSAGGVYVTVEESGEASKTTFEGTIQVDMTSTSRIKIHPGEGCAVTICVNKAAKKGSYSMSNPNIHIYDFCPLVVEEGEKPSYQRMFLYPGGYVWLKGNATLEIDEVVKCTQAQLEQLDPALLYRAGTPVPASVNEEKAEFYITGDLPPENQQVDQNGQDGQRGGSGLNGGRGGNGGDGYPGKPGEPGLPGPDVTIRIKNLKSPITVVSAGGDGQPGAKGGDGGKGGSGGNGAYLGGVGGDGGSGGDGGRGGDGGDGGAVEVYYFSENGSEVATQALPSQGGVAGQAGQGGIGGQGGTAEEIGGIGGSGGRQGSTGRNAAPGKAGKPGTIQVYDLPDPRNG